MKNLQPRWDPDEYGQSLSGGEPVVVVTQNWPRKGLPLSVERASSRRRCGTRGAWWCMMVHDGA